MKTSSKHRPVLNFEIIEKQYPNAYAELIRCRPSFGDTFIIGNHTHYEWYTRDLYDFFDGFVIHVQILQEVIGSDEWVFTYRIEYLPPEFQDAKRRCIHFEIVDVYQEYGATYSGAWDTRTKAEEMAFIKAFEILENNIKPF